MAGGKKKKKISGAGVGALPGPSVGGALSEGGGGGPGGRGGPGAVRGAGRPALGGRGSPGAEAQGRAPSAPEEHSLPRRWESGVCTFAGAFLSHL